MDNLIARLNEQADALLNSRSVTCDVIATLREAASAPGPMNCYEADAKEGGK